MDFLQYSKSRRKIDPLLDPLIVVSILIDSLTDNETFVSKLYLI